MKISVLTIALFVSSSCLNNTSSAQESAQRGGIQITSLSRQERPLFPSSHQSGDPQVQWTAYYVGNGGDHESSALTVDQSGNVYVAGKNDLAGTLGNQFDYIILKYDNEGNEKWIANYGTSGADEPINIAVDNTGNVYVHGRGGPSYNYVTLKYNSSGIQQWVNIYDGPSQSSDLGSGMALDASGNVYVTGGSTGLKYPVVGSDLDVATIKYNSDGVLQWITRYDGSLRTGSVQIILDDRGSYITVDNEGNVYVAGTTGSNICTIKYDAQGVQQWIKTYSGIGNADDYPAGIALDHSGNIYVAGTQGQGEREDIFAIKYDAAGVQQWVSTFNSPSNNYDKAYDMINDGLGNLYVCGYSRISAKSNLLLLKFTSNGGLAWCALHDTTISYADVGKALAMDAMGNIYVTGYSQTKTSSYDYLTVKYNPDGQKQWAIHYDYNKDFETANDIGVDGNGGVIVTGYEVGSNQITTIKYSQSSTDIEENDTNEPAQFQLAQNYPNPFNPTTIINFKLFKAGQTTLKVFDVSGREVITLLNEELPVGQHSVAFNAEGLTCGVYFYCLQQQGFLNYRKMVLLR